MGRRWLRRRWRRLPWRTRHKVTKAALVVTVIAIATFLFVGVLGPMAAK